MIFSRVSEKPINSVKLTADDPYEEIDISDLPKWWQECLQEFEEHDLHTYVPAHFTDGKVLHEMIRELETRHKITISLVRVGGKPDSKWTINVNESEVGTLPRRRHRSGVSIIEMKSEEFAELIDRALLDE